MNKIDLQETYWDSIAAEKAFTHPIAMDKIREAVEVEGKILDYGCGYGRTCVELKKDGFGDVVGVDISSQMIACGQSLYPGLELLHFDGVTLPFPDESFVACTLLAVLTCIPTNIGQKRAIAEINRVLIPDGILFVSDYPFQQDAGNQDRYHQFENEFGVFGVFRLSDGGVVRHHDMPWIYELLSQFDIINEDNIKVSTMNGNAARIFQILARKKKQAETVNKQK